MITKIKNLFQNKEFTRFVIIGFIAYLLNQLLYILFIQIPIDDEKHIFATSIAYILTSIFTFIANMKWSFNSNYSNKKLILSIISFIVKFFLYEGICYVVIWINGLFIISTINKIIEILIPFFATGITMIMQYFCFKYIFKNNQKNIKPTLIICFPE